MRPLIIVLALLRLAYGQGATIPLSVQQARPLWGAARLLEQKFGISVAYEDVAYTSLGDLVNRNGRGLVPRQGVLSFAIDSAMLSAGSNGAATLAQQLVGQHQANGNPGQFKVLRLLGENTIAIVPVSASPLDTRISLPDVERDGEQALTDLCQAVTSTSGKVVKNITPPAKGLAVSLGARNGVARDVLVGILSGLHWKDPRNVAKLPMLTWALTYDPDRSEYLMQIHQVRREHRIPNGVTTLSPVYR